MTLSDFETSLSPLALALRFLCVYLSVSLLGGPHRGMTCVRFVRTGWPESLENVGRRDRSSISTRSNACGQCKTSLLETSGGKKKTWVIALFGTVYGYQTPRLMHLKCISDSNESCSSSSHYALESRPELSDLMLIQSHLRGQEDHSHSNEGVFTPWEACQ